MIPFKDLLRKFDITLRNYNSPNYDKLYSPLRIEEIKFRLNRLNIENDNLIDFFSWKNGFNPDLDINIICELFDFGAPLSLEAIEDKVQANKNLNLWDESFLPLVTDGTGQYLLFNNSHGSYYGRIHLYSSSLLFVEEPISYYDSISSMLKTTIKAYEIGALIYDEIEDWLDKDVDNFHAIAKKNNNFSKYWDL